MSRRPFDLPESAAYTERGSPFAEDLTMTIFDAHAHCFPPLGEDRGIMKTRLAEHQYHVRFHRQGIRRISDDVED